MSPKAMNYRANSIIYFTGDPNDKIFLLKSGRVSLNSRDIETGQEVHDVIQTGEFFGVKSALGRYPKEETAVVLTDSQALLFTVAEFEQLALQNTRLIVKMLRIFSNQLRFIHKKVKNLIPGNDQASEARPEDGLFKIGEYYLKNRLYPQALYVFKRYLTYYPSGSQVQDVTRKIEIVEQAARQAGAGRTPVIDEEALGVTSQAATGPRPDKGREVTDVARAYYDAVSLYSQNKYQESLRAFRMITEKSQEPEYSAKAEFEMGRCMFSLSDFDNCIKHFTSLVQKYPKHPELNEILFHIGRCHEAKENNDKAVGFYKMILTKTTEADPVFRKVKKQLKALEGGKA